MAELEAALPTIDKAEVMPDLEPVVEKLGMGDRIFDGVRVHLKAEVARLLVEARKELVALGIEMPAGGAA